MVDVSYRAASKASSSVRTQDGAIHQTQLERMLNSNPRPFVLINERELSVLRRGLTKDGWKRSLYLEPASDSLFAYSGAGLLSSANRWLDEIIEIPERSGHYHHFFCDCGSRLQIPEKLKVGGEYLCPECSKSYSGEKYDGAVRFLIHNKVAGAAMALALVYGIEKERAYADKAAEILLKYAEAYPGPHTDCVTGGILYQSLCESVWVIPLAQVYDLIYYSRSLDEEQKALIEHRLFRPVAEGLMACGIDGNWGSWHLAAVGVIGCAIKETAYVRYAIESFNSQIAEQLGEDGLWPESVHTYHFYPLSAFVHLAEALSRIGIDIYSWEVRPGKSLKSMFAAPLQYMYPSFKLPAINDGWYDSFLPLDLYEIAYRRWNDPAFAWVLKKGYKFSESPLGKDQETNTQRLSRRGFYSFLFGRDLPGRLAAPVFASSYFTSLGVCTLRNNDGSMVTLDCGPFLGHGHLDKLSFTFYANNQVMVPDYGTPGYGSGIREWYQCTASHNTVVVDGQVQGIAKQHGLVSRYCGEFVQLAEGVADDCYEGVTHIRRMLLIGDTCIVDDLLTSSSEHNYDWLIRCEGEPELLGSYEPSDANFDVHPLISCSQMSKVRDSYQLRWKCEQGYLSLGIWNSLDSCDIALGTCPSETASRLVSSLTCRKTSSNVRFLATLVPSKLDEDIEVNKDGCVIKIAKQNKVDYVFLRDTSQDETSIPLQTDASIAIVRTQNDQVTSVALLMGSWIKWNGGSLIECPAAVSCVEVSFEDRNPVIRYCGDTAGILKIKTNARAMKINNQRAAATNNDGLAALRVTSQMIADVDYAFGL